MKDFRQTKTTHLTLLPFIVRRYREFECRLIISNDNETKLALVKNKFRELKDWKYTAKSDFFYHTLLRNKTQLIIINNVIGTTENALNGRVYLPKAITK
jgi:hypothetical protein